MKYSLIHNPSGCFNVIKEKAKENYVIKKILDNVNLCNFFLFQWFLLNVACFPIQIVTNWFLNNFYWFLLGVLSSIGLGTGLQTGVLFVLPYIINVFNENKNNYIEQNPLLNNTLSTQETYNIIYQTYFDCLRVVLIWGIGTAFGEAPPYIIAYNIDMKDKKATTSLFKMFGDNEQKVRNYIDNTVYYLKRYSFTTILALSAWPNALFDMCGVSAGLVKLSFTQFIFPTIIGKAFVKNPIQLGIILYYYGFWGDEINKREETSYLYMGWIIFVISFTLYFIKEAVENIVNSN